MKKLKNKVNYIFKIKKSKGRFFMEIGGDYLV